MSVADRLRPTHETRDGRRVRVLGEPFEIGLPVPPGARDRCPPIFWVATLHADGTVRPLRVEELRR